MNVLKLYSSINDSYMEALTGDDETNTRAETINWIFGIFFRYPTIRISCTV